MDKNILRSDLGPIAIDLMKYVTVYKGAFTREQCRNITDTFYTAPHGPGYLLTPPHDWGSMTGMRRLPKFEFYRNPEDLEPVLGGSHMYKDFDARYPDDKILSDDTAYYPLMSAFDLFKRALDDYRTRWGINTEITQFCPLEFRYYNEFQGASRHCDYAGHLDKHPKAPWGYQSPRKPEDLANESIAFNLYPNDDYDGGYVTILRYIELPDGTFTEEGAEQVTHYPEAGDVMMFPCAFPYEHWVQGIGEDQRRWLINGNAIDSTPPIWQFS